MKKLLSMLICIILTLPAMAVNAETEGTEGTFENLKYTAYNDYVEITGYVGEPTEIVIPSEINGISVTQISENSFANCWSLTDITIPDSVLIIEAGVFQQCSNLTSVVLPSNIKEIGAMTFSVCEKLTNITIPDSVTKINESAFGNCSSLMTINIPNNAVYIGDYTFGSCTALENITIPESIEYIGDGAFSYCSSLTEFKVNENNSNYADVNGVLFNKEKTKLITCPAGNARTEYIIPNTTTHIEDNAFSGCSDLKSINIPTSVVDIGSSAFSGCSSLTEISIPNNVSDIPYLAFADCISLTNINISENVVSINSTAFNGCDSLTNINVNENNSCYASVEGVLFDKSITQLISYPAGKIQETYTVPNSVNLIKEYSFYGSKLKSAIISNNVAEIEYEAFGKSNSLISVSIGNGTTKIGNRAFESCGSLTSIHIDDSNENYSDIDGILFNKDKSVLIKYPEGKSQTEYHIPKGVTKIYERAFINSNNITKIYMYNDVTSIGFAAFLDCKKLSDIYFTGTEAEWEKINNLEDIGLSRRTRIHYNDNRPIIEKVAVTNSGNKYTFTLTISDVSDNCRAIAVIYGGTNEMTGIGMTDLIIDDTEKSITVTSNNAVNAKILIWDSFEGMKPLCNVEEITLE